MTLTFVCIDLVAFSAVVEKLNTYIRIILIEIVHFGNLENVSQN